MPRLPQLERCTAQGVVVHGTDAIYHILAALGWIPWATVAREWTWFPPGLLIDRQAPSCRVPGTVPGHNLGLVLDTHNSHGFPAGGNGKGIGFSATFWRDACLETCS